MLLTDVLRFSARPSRPIGLLLHQFQSPHSDRCDDQYGGSLENRMRFVPCMTEREHTAIPAELPLFVRISATDWVAGGCGIEQSVELSRRLEDPGLRPAPSA